jgi:hypothetical protein
MKDKEEEGENVACHMYPEALRAGQCDDLCL